MLTVQELLERKGIIDAHTGDKEKILKINSLKDAVLKMEKLRSSHFLKKE